ncbi:hypothetical protein [Azospirillum argentinense]
MGNHVVAKSVVWEPAGRRRIRRSPRCSGTEERQIAAVIATRA